MAVLERDTECDRGARVREYIDSVREARESRWVEREQYKGREGIERCWGDSDD